MKKIIISSLLLLLLNTFIDLLQVKAGNKKCGFYFNDACMPPFLNLVMDPFELQSLKNKMHRADSNGTPCLPTGSSKHLQEPLRARLLCPLTFIFKKPICFLTFPG